MSFFFLENFLISQKGLIVLKKLQADYVVNAAQILQNQAIYHCIFHMKDMRTLIFDKRKKLNILQLLLYIELDLLKFQ